MSVVAGSSRHESSGANFVSNLTQPITRNFNTSALLMRPPKPTQQLQQHTMHCSASNICSMRLPLCLFSSYGVKCPNTLHGSIMINVACCRRLASVDTSNYRAYLKTHSKENSYKCNQFDYTSVHASYLRRHLKIYFGEK